MGNFSLLAGMLLLIAYLTGLFVPLYATAKNMDNAFPDTAVISEI